MKKNKPTPEEIEEWRAYMVWCEDCNEAAEEQYREEQRNQPT